MKGKELFLKYINKFKNKKNYQVYNEYDYILYTYKEDETNKSSIELDYIDNLFQIRLSCINKYKEEYNCYLLKETKDFKKAKRLFELLIKELENE